MVERRAELPERRRLSSEYVPDRGRIRTARLRFRRATRASSIAALVLVFGAVICSSSHRGDNPLSVLERVPLRHQQLQFFLHRDGTHIVSSLAIFESFVRSNKIKS